MLIRARRDADLPACAALMREVHTADGYPRYLPADLAGFLALPGSYGCWIAEDEAGVSGHVALVPRGLPATLAVAANALNRPENQLAVVARLLVSPRARGHGTGRELLKTATDAAIAKDLYPVLDVDTKLRGAIALYESAGWTQAGQVTVDFGDGRTLTEYVYLAPPAKPGTGRNDRVTLGRL